MSSSPPSNAAGDSKTAPQSGTVSWIESSMLGVGIAIGGFFSFWNEGLHLGYCFFFFCVLLMGLGFICSTCCLAEMTSTLSFTGGMYGFARLTLGPYLGFVVGCCEILQNILRASCFMFCFAMHFCVALNISLDYEPIFWLLFLAVTILSNIAGGPWFWKFSSTVGVLAVLVILFFLVATAPSTDFKNEAMKKGEETPSVDTFLRFFPYSTWFFVGMEMIPVMSSDVKEVSALPFVVVLYVCILTPQFSLHITGS